MPPPVVVVGASVAGVSAVDELREAGFDGEVVLVGAEPQLPYDRPPLSKELLQGARSPAELWLRPPSWYEDHGVTLELGVRAVALDPAAAEIALDDGRALRYRAALVATGASPREIPGLAGIEGVHLLRTLDDATRLAEVLERGGRVTVVGGGFIGLEVAASARARGCAVTVLEARESVLADAVGPAVGDVVAELHAAAGVEVITGAAVKSPVVEDGRVAGLELASGRVVQTDTVVVGVGVEPATSWLDGSGVELRDGVLVDRRLRSSAPGVFAAGDVARLLGDGGTSTRIEHWTNAVEQGRLAGRNMSNAGDMSNMSNVASDPGGMEEFDAVPNFWSDQHGARIRMMGAVADPSAVVVARHEADPLRVVALAVGDGDVLTGVVTIGAASALAKCRPLLGEPGSASEARRLVAG